MRFRVEDFAEQSNTMAEDLGTPPPFRQQEAYEWMLRNPLPPQNPQHTHISSNTYISVALLIMLLGGVIWMTNTINRFDTSITSLSNSLKEVQNVHESWSYHDMFKWCVHLQRDNPQIKIPEPEAPK